MTSPSPASYQARFLERGDAEHYANREYGADSYSASVWTWQAPLVSKTLEEIRRRNPVGRHLDFACGTGRITSLAEKIFPDIDALDISPSMVEIARGVCSQARFFVGNILENPGFCPGPYTSLTAFRLLLNLDPALRVPILHGLSERLAPDGAAVINLHGNRHSLRQPAILWKRWRLRDRIVPAGLMLNAMNRGEVMADLEAGGFVVEDVYGSGVLPPTVYRWPGRKAWSRLDRWLSTLPFLRNFCIDLVFVCRKHSR